MASASLSRHDSAPALSAQEHDAAHLRMLERGIGPCMHTKSKPVVHQNTRLKNPDSQEKTLIILPEHPVIW
jgi:hypothetical protein